MPTFHGADDEDFPDYAEPAVRSGTSGKAIASLVFGILSFCLPLVATIPAVVLAILTFRDTSQSQGRLKGNGLAIAGIVTGVIGMVSILPTIAMIGLLLPAFQKVQQATERMQGMNNLKQLGIAMHNYHSAQGQFPPRVVTDKAGKPLYSWRVLILPYIEKDDLYKQFKLDEPWDSPNNLPLLKLMPKTFDSVIPGGDPTKTHFQVFDGKGAAFETVPPAEEKTARKIPGWFPDGTANTWLIVEAANPVPWTKPEDLTYDPKGPLPKLGGLRPGGFLAAYVDGSVKLIPPKISEQTMRALITRNGNEPIPSDAP